MTWHTARVPVPRRSEAPHRVAKIAIVIVTYNSRRHVESLVGDLRRQRGDLDLRMVAVDNASSDGTPDLLRTMPGVQLVEAGANLGYAGGINLVWNDVVNDCDAVLVVNPDLRLEDTALHELWTRLQQSQVAAVVPRMMTAEGTRYPSLRFEPTLRGALGDALLGKRFPHRPRWMTGMDNDQASYDHAHPVDWATGACMLIRSDVARAVGPWDEQYFLYSEEVDYLRRLREAGWDIWYEPASCVRHEGGGSGTSPELAALEAVNAIRYADRWHGRAYAELVRVVAVLRALLRVHRPAGRAALAYLVSRRRWAALPSAERVPDTASAGAGLSGSVVIPAHNEATVVHRSVLPLLEAARSGDLELVVSANGCTDDTIERLLELDGVTIVNSAVASKTTALNAGDAVASRWPRLYLDADVEITPRAVADVFRVLRDGQTLAARPRFVYDTAGADWFVRAYYRARIRLPETTSHLWGGGSYALGEEGHRVLGAFPDVVADDLHIDSLFSPSEKAVVDTEPVRVHTPRDVRSLVATLGRINRGNAESAAPATRGRVARQLAMSATSPSRVIDAAVYLVLSLLGRRLGRRTGTAWARDDGGRRAA